MFAYHNPSTRLIASLTESVTRANCAGHLKEMLEKRAPFVVTEKLKVSNIR